MRWPAQVVEVVQRVRKLDLKKAPSISETLDWAKTLTLLNAEAARRDSWSNDTLSAILKYEGRHPQSAGRAQGIPADRRTSAPRRRPGDDKDLLH